MRYLHFNHGQNTDVNRRSRIIPDILNDLTLAVILELRKENYKHAQLNHANEKHV